MTAWTCQHHGRPGSYDESARRASHQELAVAQLLAAEGHHVRTVAERRGQRSPDLMACATSVEVKSFQSLADRGGAPPRPASVANKLLDARGQGAVTVLWGPGSGLSRATAEAGFQLFCQQALVEGLGRSRGARIIGDGFDLTLSPQAGLRRARAQAVAETGKAVTAPPLTRPLGTPVRGALRSAM